MSSVSRGSSKRRLLFTSRVSMALAALLATPGQANPPFPASNGLIAFESDRDSPNRVQSEIYVMKADGSDETRLTTQGGWGASWSPDGTKIAFASHRDGDDEIYVMNADGSGQTRLAERPNATDIYPAWSPDGSKIAFSSFDCCPIGANYDVWVMNADGTDPINITNHPLEDSNPSWSPDGSKIAFQTRRDGNTEIYTVQPDGTGLTNLTNTPLSGEWTPDWSPDGSKIAFSGKRDTPAQGSDVYVMNADGTSVTRLTDTHVDHMPAWSPSGSRITFVSGRDFNQEIYVMGATGGNEVRLTHTTPPGLTWPHDYSPDWQPGSADDTPPQISCHASPDTLWPPDRKLHRVRVAVSTSDDMGPTVVTLASVRSTQADDPDDVQGWTTGVDDRVGLLRAERARTARTYTFVYQAEDLAGNTTRCEARVRVPASRGPSTGAR